LNVQGPLPKHTPLLVDALCDLGCQVELLPWGRRTEGERLPAKVSGRVRDVLVARRRIVRRDFSMVVVKTAHDWLTITRDLALVYSLPGDVTIVLQFHGSQSPRLVAPGSWLFKRATAMLLDRVDAILVLSKEEQAQWRTFSPKSRVFVVRNPRPMPAAATPGRAPNGTPTILCVSRLLPGKGVLELVCALPAIQREVPCRLVFAGDGPEAARLSELAATLGVRNSVELRGYVEGPELATLYDEATVFALPTSLSEGFPTAILEAMAAGLPIVTTRSRGPADHLVEGQHALFVPIREPEALATALVRVLGDADLRRKMASANRAKVHDFDADVVAKEYLAVLESIRA
jgi:glycosyltransferase involved in cell wall biosynthesis